MKYDRKKLILIAISIFLSMLFIDETGVAVTLPQIQADLGMSDTALQWVMNGMFLPLSILVLFGGKLSDHIGHRKTFVIGMGLFLFASVVCALASNSMLIISGRVLQGVGASLLLATYAVLISMVFPENERGMALGTSASFASIFLATGPFIGGAFAHYLSWRWIFGVNLPLGLLSLYYVYRCIDKDVIEQPRSKFDLSGLLLFVLGFTALIYSLMQAADFGWTSSITVGLLVVAIILLPIFAALQLNKHNPLADLSLFKNRTFLAGTVILLCTQVVVMSLTYWAIWLQKSLGMSALVAGLGLLPAGLPILVTARMGGVWLDKKGPKMPIAVGSIIILFGMIWLTATAQYQNYWLAFVGFLAYGIGAPFVISPAIAIVLGSVEPMKRGMAAGMLNTMRQLGATLCFAVVGVCITNVNQIQMASKNTFNNVVAAQTYTHAFSYGMLITAVFALITCCFSLGVLRNR